MQATIALALLILSSIDISMAKKTEILNINEGEPFELKCATNLHYPVVWYFQQAHRPREIDLFLGGEISMMFKNMFILKGNQSVGEYNLLIPSADGRYVGNYRCIDDEGLGSELLSIQITIIASTSAAIFGENAPATTHHEAAISYQKEEHSNSILNPAAVCGIVLSVVIVAAITIIIIIIVVKRRCVTEHAPKSDDVGLNGKQRRSRIPSSTSEKSTSSKTPLV